MSKTELIEPWKGEKTQMRDVASSRGAAMTKGACHPFVTGLKKFVIEPG